MPEEVRMRLQEQAERSGGVSEGIGFANVSRRISAMYPDSKIELMSKEGKGTVVKIQIPLKDV